MAFDLDLFLFSSWVSESGARAWRSELSTQSQPRGNGGPATLKHFEKGQSALSATKKSSLVLTMGWRRGLRVSKAGIVVIFSILANLLQDFKTSGDQSSGVIQRTALGPVQEASLMEL